MNSTDDTGNHWGADVRMKIIMTILTPPIFIVGKSIIAVIYVHYWFTTGLQKLTRKVNIKAQDWY